ncbi:hypothetical protein NMY22_g3037 [Coprinellus aureogranulatus]|nr:hypothetical protein NMY22_g3037 [Coprinellus aureogranulatus]
MSSSTSTSMSTMPGANNAAALSYPALYLYPLNDSFVPKHIALSHGQHVKIGRQTNAKTAPGERNEYLDGKVSSRKRAAVWEEGRNSAITILVVIVAVMNHYHFQPITMSIRLLEQTMLSNASL